MKKFSPFQTANQLKKTTSQNWGPVRYFTSALGELNFSNIKLCSIDHSLYNHSYSVIKNIQLMLAVAIKILN